MARQQVEKLPLIALRGRVVFPGTSLSFDVGRLTSLAAVKRATDESSLIMLVAQKDASKTDITIEDFYLVGSVARLKQISRIGGANIRVTVEAQYRAAINSVDIESGCFVARVSELKAVRGDASLEEAYFRTTKDIIHELSEGDSRMGKDIKVRKLPRTGPVRQFRRRRSQCRHGCKAEHSRMYAGSGQAQTFG